MADGATVQRASLAALADGVTLPWILEELKSLTRATARHILLHELSNSICSFGLMRCRATQAAAGRRRISSIPCPSRRETISSAEPLDAQGLDRWCR